MEGRPDDPKKPKRFNPFMARTRAMSSGGAQGWESYTIGFTLVGCIVAGAGAGYFLDQHFGTSYWLPILFLVGVVGGFREMMVVLKRVNEEQTAQRLKRQSERAAREVTVKPTTDPTPDQIKARQRMFAVPPPPFEKAAEAVTKKAAPREQVSVENVLEEMLAKGDLSAEDLKELGFDVEVPDSNGETADGETTERG